jgi:hypothetical protein
MKAFLLAVLLLLLATVGDAQKNALPAFEEYRVVETFRGKSVPPQITESHRWFRTIIQRGAAKGPNFAGQYTIATWGCGTGCVSMAIIDAKDGSVRDGPFSDLGLGNAS